MSEWITVREYAVLYHVHRKTVRKWLEAGLIDYYRVQRIIRVQNKPPKDFATQSMASGKRAPSDPS